MLNRAYLSNIGDVFMSALSSNPNEIAVIDDEKKYSYKDIAELIAGFQYTFFKK